jgi:hypothetical protein
MNFLVQYDEGLNVLKSQVASFSPWLVGVRAGGKEAVAYHRTG